MTDFIVFTSAEIEAARELDDTDAWIGGRLVDGPDAGELTGRYVVNARVLADPTYERWHAMLAALPVQDLDTDVIFAPPPDE